MKKSIKNFGFLVAAAVLIVPAAAMAQTSASANANATANILEPIAITTGATLDFGDLVADATSAGTMTVTTAGVFTPATIQYLTGAAVGTMNVSGEASRAFSVSAAAGTLSNGTFTMNVAPTVDCATMPCALSGAGLRTVRVGGVLSVGAAQDPGVYNGTFAVTVQYN